MTMDHEAIQPAASGPSTLKPSESSSFPYEPLDTEVDSTRFIQIETATSAEAPISCKLIHIAFGRRPKFEAVSYMWGDCEDGNIHAILLDGLEFHVGGNLRDVLHHLRQQAEGKLFWIDALCVNQTDLAERSRQVRMMGQIYFRATTVITWLGSKYATYQQSLSSRDLQNITSRDHESESRADEVVEHPNPTADIAAESDERLLAKMLLEDGYWDRLWIIQEVAQARTLKVSFGTWDWTWDHFIHFLTAHNLGDGGPLRLSRQLRETHKTGHSICQLFRDHHRASCKDRKDMIYGLVGLATDAVGFPIDYEKSLIEIWTDTMEFLNGRRLLAQGDIVPMGQLLKEMLMGRDCTPLDQVLCPSYDPTLEPTTLIENNGTFDKKVFEVQGYFLGSIASVGPSTRAIVAEMSAVSAWHSALVNNFGATLGEATRENKKLLRTILDSDDSALDRMCHSHISNIRWVSKVGFLNTDYVKRRLYETLRGRGVGFPDNDFCENNAKIIDSTYTQLYQMRGVYQDEVLWKTGIVSLQAQPGDIVCCITKLRHNVVIRLGQATDGGYSERMQMQIFGTSLRTEDVAGAAADSERCISYLKKRGFGLEIKMDARTLFVLIS